MIKYINRRRVTQQRPSLDADSLTSFFSPWQKNRAPPIYPNAQTGRTVDLPEFLLFFVAVILLVATLGLASMSLWSFFFKSYYSFLDCSTELAYFALPVAGLCLPSSWIVFSVHNDKKSRRFLSLVLILLTFSIVVMVIGVYVGFYHKLNLKPGDIEGNPILVEFRGSLKRSMAMYGRGEKSGNDWDEMQGRLECCGVDNYTDWIPVVERIPESCCYYSEVYLNGTCSSSNLWKIPVSMFFIYGLAGSITFIKAVYRFWLDASCRYNSTFATGCLKIITATLASQTCLFSGINCVALFLQSCALVLVASIYFCGKRRGQEGASGERVS